MMFRQFPVLLAIVERRGCCVHAPGRQRRLEALYRRQRLCNALRCTFRPRFGQDHTRARLPGKRLPGALLGGQRGVEKPLGLRPRERQILLGNPKLCKARFELHAPVPVEGDRLPIHLGSRRRQALERTLVVS